MSIRIRYTKHPEGGVESIRIITLPSGDQVRVRVLADNIAVILDAITLTVLYEQTCTSQHAAKIYIKNTLTGLGVEFGEETRTRSS
jgi:hypothetical protein